MARKRSITSAMGADERIEQVAGIDPVYGLMWPWLLTAFGDWGRLDITSIGKIRMEYFPAFSSITNQTIGSAFNAYVSAELVHRYQVNDRTYLAIQPKRWMKWQKYLSGTKRANTAPDAPTPIDAPWPATEDEEFEIWLTKPSERSLLTAIKHSNMSVYGCETEENDDDNIDCLRTNADVCGQSALSVPSPSPSPLPSPLPSQGNESYGGCGGRPGAVAPDRSRGSGPGGKLAKPDKKHPPDRSSMMFDEFWSFYPKKAAKGAARKAFAKIKPSDELHKKILAAIIAARKSEAWLRDGGQYIPHPATWLNQERWLDEYAPSAPPGRASPVAKNERADIIFRD